VNQEAFFETVLRALEGCRVPYMIAGSVAAMSYGEPRLTSDMDVVVELAPEHVEALLALFQGDDYYAPSAEFVGSIVATGGAFNIVHVASASKVDLIVRRHNDFAVREFSRRRPLPFTEEFEAFVATPEDVIQAQAFRQRHEIQIVSRGVALQDQHGPFHSRRSPTRDRFQLREHLVETVAQAGSTWPASYEIRCAA